jgi:hypothetical protein
MELYEIIEAAKSNKPVDKEDMIYAIIALDGLWLFEKRAIRDLAEAKRGDRQPILGGDPIHQEKESFRRAKAALSKDPKEYVGWINDPKNPDYQRFRRSANNLMEKIIKKTKEKKERRKEAN